MTRCDRPADLRGLIDHTKDLWKTPFSARQTVCLKFFGPRASLASKHDLMRVRDGHWWSNGRRVGELAAGRSLR
jgi:hypothetical protein